MNAASVTECLRRTKAWLDDNPVDHENVSVVMFSSQVIELVCEGMNDAGERFEFSRLLFHIQDQCRHLSQLVTHADLSSRLKEINSANSIWYGQMTSQCIFHLSVLAQGFVFRSCKSGAVTTSVHNHPGATKVNLPAEILKLEIA